MMNKSKSMSEALIFASTNPQHDNSLFIELRVQYMKIASSEHLQNMLCTQIGFLIYVHNMFCRCSELAIFMYCTCNSMNTLLSYYGLVDARISATEKDLSGNKAQKSSIVAVVKTSLGCNSGNTK